MAPQSCTTRNLYCEAALSLSPLSVCVFVCEDTCGLCEYISEFERGFKKSNENLTISN